MLQRGVPEFPSQIHAYQSLDSLHELKVVVAAVANCPLVVEAETAHCVELAAHVGALFEFAVGGVVVLHTRR